MNCHMRAFKNSHVNEMPANVTHDKTFTKMPANVTHDKTFTENRANVFKAAFPTFNAEES